MSDTDDIDAIRREKREALEEKLAGGDGAAATGADAESPAGGDGAADAPEGRDAVAGTSEDGDAAGDASEDGDASEGGDAAGDGTDAAPTEPVHVEGGDHLQELADSYDVVLVDFYADWCGPCRMLEPVVEAVAAETPAAVAKVDIDVLQGLAAQAGVRSVPTMLLYADGEPVERLVGVQDQARLEGLVEEYAG